MFGDGQWLAERTERQEAQLADWLNGLHGANFVIVECGAGNAIPTVRSTGEALARRHQGTLIRINPREPQGPAGTISFATGAMTTLTAIDTVLQSL